MPKKVTRVNTLWRSCLLVLITHSKQLVCFVIHICCPLAHLSSNVLNLFSLQQVQQHLQQYGMPIIRLYHTPAGKGCIQHTYHKRRQLGRTLVWRIAFQSRLKKVWSVYYAANNELYGIFKIS